MKNNKQIIKDKLFQQVDLKQTKGIKRLINNGVNFVKYKFLKSKSKKNNDVIEIITKTFFEKEMHVFIPEIVSNHILLYGYYDEPVTYIAIETLNEGDVFIDVGAHFGYMSMLGSFLVGKSGQVYSFEPTPSTFKILNSNTQNENQIKTENLAVFNENSKIEIVDLGIQHSAYNSISNNRVTIENKHNDTKEVVDAICLDDYIENNNIIPNLIKIDAENSEYEILLGAKNSLTRFGPSLIVELGDSETNRGHSRKIIDFLQSLNYSIYEYNNQQLVKHKPKEIYSDINLLFRME